MFNKLLIELYHDITKWWLIGILIFLPFQHTTVKIIQLWNNDASVFIKRLDEFTIIGFVLLSTIELYRRDRLFNRQYIIIFFPLICLMSVGLISGIVNENRLLPTIHGIFNYTKYFLVIFIYATFFKNFRDFKKILNILLGLILFLGAVALIQEIWALSNRYIFQKRIAEILYLDFSTLISEERELRNEFAPWRLGIYRTPSLMINYNFFGLYCLLILTIYINVIERTKLLKLFFIIFGIFCSVSRVVYSGFILTGLFQVFRGKKKWIIILIPFIVLLFYLSPLPEYLMSKFSSKSMFARSFAVYDKLKRDEVYKSAWDGYRIYMQKKGIEIWKDNMFLGVGPGMFGSGLSIRYNSPIYEKYNFDEPRIEVLKRFKTIDNFWIQILAELGILGIVCLMAFFIFLALRFYKLKKISPQEMEGIYRGLIIYMLVILIYSFGYDMNIPPIIYTYFAFVGIAINDK